MHVCLLPFDMHVPFLALPLFLGCCIFVQGLLLYAQRKIFSSFLSGDVAHSRIPPRNYMFMFV